MSGAVSIEDLSIVATEPDGRVKTLVASFSLRLAAGEVVALIGESGAGKSTIGLAALGYLRPGCRIAAGRIVVSGKDVFSLDRKALQFWRGRQAAYVAQNAAAAFDPSIRIVDQLIEAAQIHRLMDARSAFARAAELSEIVDLPDPVKTLRKFPHEFSGGQLQRLMTVMALMCRPSLLVLDEPTTAIDVPTQLGVLIALKRVITRERSSCLYISHDLAVVAQMADRIIVLRDGNVVEANTTREILTRPTAAYTAQLVAAHHLPPKAEAAAQGASPAPETILEVRHLEAVYGHGRGKVEALEDINFTVHRGRCVGIVGESGSGKSTLAKVIAGLHGPSSGAISLAGVQLAARAERRSKEQLRRAQIVFQSADLALNPRVQVRDILGRPLEFYFGHRGKAKEERVDRLLELVELPPRLASRYPTQLSGGQMQRVNLARALAAEPDLLICDEVTSALDTILGSNILVLLASLQARMNMACLFITHDLSKVGALADNLCVMRQGRVVEYGPAHRVLNAPLNSYTRQLIASVPELRPDWLVERAEFRASHPEEAEEFGRRHFGQSHNPSTTPIQLSTDPFV